MEFRKARPADRKELQALWKTCFSDGENETALYFDTYGTDNCFVCAQEQLAAMVLYFPSELILPDGESVQCAYLYCFCTSPEQRGKGIGRELLQFAESELKKQGFACTALSPAEESLFAYYEKFGYVPAFGCTKQTFSAGVCEAQAKPVSANRYLQLRQMMLWENCLMYAEREIEFNKALYRFCGGDLVEITTADNIGCAAVRRNGEELLICDLLTDSPKQAAQAVMKLFSAQKATAIFPGQTPCGMLKWLNAPKPVENAFMGLTYE